MITAENILLVGSVLIFTSILISKTGYRFGIPTLLLFLLVGMAFGSDGLGIQFNSASDAQFIGMMALSIILFSGGMDTRYSDIKPVLKQGILLSTVGVLVTTLLTGLFIYFLSNHTQANIELTLLVSLLLAATMSSTDSASVFSLLRSQRMNLKYNLRPMLELESGSNDPMAYMLTIVLIQVIGSGSNFDIVIILKDLFLQFLFGGVLGYAFGKFSVWLINKIELSNSSLYPILLLSIIFITFTLTDLVKGNGYLAVYIAGMIVGNARLAYRKETNTFMNGLTWLFQIIMFLTLGLLVNPHEMIDIAVTALLIGIFNSDSTTGKCIFMPASLQRNQQQSTHLYFMGRIKRSRSHHFCNVSCHCPDTRFQPVVQHRVLHHSAVTYHTRYDNLENGTLAQAGLTGRKRRK